MAVLNKKIEYDNKESVITPEPGQEKKYWQSLNANDIKDVVNQNVDSANAKYQVIDNTLDSHSSTLASHTTTLQTHQTEINSKLPIENHVALVPGSESGTFNELGEYDGILVDPADIQNKIQLINGKKFLVINPIAITEAKVLKSTDVINNDDELNALSVKAAREIVASLIPSWELVDTSDFVPSSNVSYIIPNYDTNYYYRAWVKCNVSNGSVLLTDHPNLSGADGNWVLLKTTTNGNVKEIQFQLRKSLITIRDGGGFDAKLSYLIVERIAKDSSQMLNIQKRTLIASTQDSVNNLTFASDKWNQATDELYIEFPSVDLDATTGEQLRDVHALFFVPNADLTTKFANDLMGIGPNSGGTSASPAFVTARLDKVGSNTVVTVYQRTTNQTGNPQPINFTGCYVYREKKL